MYLKRKVYLTSKGNIWGVDLADMQLISKYHKVFQLFNFQLFQVQLLLGVIDMYSRYTWIAPLKDKKNVLQSLMLFRNF